ncbi:hypothetical protein SFR_0513 [Streptomyces sp. FR-008]|nr:hypothetical protein SFR_0513 [Streptomyces sp. FR-008]
MSQLTPPRTRFPGVCDRPCRPASPPLPGVPL